MTARFAPGARAAMLEKLEWAKIHTGAYLVEGYIVRRGASGHRWYVWTAETIGDRRDFTLQYEAPTMTEAMEWIADEKELG